MNTERRSFLASVVALFPGAFIGECGAFGLGWFFASKPASKPAEPPKPNTVTLKYRDAVFTFPAGSIITGDSIESNPYFEGGGQYFVRHTLRVEAAGVAFEIRRTAVENYDPLLGLRNPHIDHEKYHEAIKALPAVDRSRLVGGDWNYGPPQTGDL